ncbi:hypothetical protein [Sporolactobacillus vineae]|uniref:lmo0954 family membrane protein n=1 Tax=Sporolactobacillus vineae TaxID=444463 RepID=UPI000289A16B|nr:hypothetical protein [Sporolactobacillus vineae]
MKKVMLFILGTILLIILLTHIGPMIGLLISLTILWFAFRKFIRAESTGAKVLWVLVGLIALSFSVANVPAVIGAAALIALFYVYKAWKTRKEEEHVQKDPFDNFDRQWKEFM